MTNEFDLAQAIKALQSGQDLTGKDGFLTPLIKQITEAALKTELQQHLENDKQPNRKNGSSKKTIKSSVGSFELDTPRDRSGSFEPQLVKKNQTKLTDEIDRKILSMFSLGMSYRDIRGHVEDMYGIDVSEDRLESKWGQQYPIVLRSWRNKWENLSVFFKYPAYVRKAIYTTNAIEAVHRQFRKLTKTKGGFPNENSLLKLLYAGILNASKKWTMPIQNWNMTLSQLAIHFEGRLDDVLDI